MSRLAGELDDAGGISASRRERRKQEVRERIFDAAMELFVARGVGATTLDDIAEYADVARATVYNHFGKKTDIVSEWGARNRQRLRDAIDDSFRARPVREQLTASFEVLVDVYEADRGRACVLFSLHVGDVLGESPELATILADLLAEAQERGEVREDVDPLRIGLALRASYLDTLYRWSQGGPQPPFDLRAALRELVDVLVSGIGR